MHFKVTLIAAVLAVCAARPQHHGHAQAPAAYSSQSIQRHDVPAKAPEGHFDHQGPAKYEFAYSVKDPHTGDVKEQREQRDGHVVKGHYSLHQPDGTVRIVHYTADKHSGFNAKVKYEGHAKHVAPAHQH